MLCDDCDVRAIRRRLIQRHRQPLDPGGPAHARRRIAAQALDQPVIAPAGQYRARDVVHALRTAAKDDRIKAVVLDLSKFTGGGMVTLQDVGAAMDEVRAARKPVLTYAVGYADDGMLLAAHTSEVWVDPMGGAVVLGPGGNNIYFGGLIEKLKVEFAVELR